MTTSSRFVVDASIGVKWFVAEDDSKLAMRLLDPSIIRVVPGLFFTEVTQTIWKKARLRRELTEEEARRIVRDLRVEPLAVYPTDLILEPAFEIAMATGRSVYDSMYLALAEDLRCPLVTADQRLYNGLQGTAYESMVIRLADLPRLFPADPDSGMMEADPEPA